MAPPAPPILAAIDAHQHFFDLENNRYPWLQDGWLPDFRYGDYTAICRSYLPEHYAEDTAGQNIVASVHIEAEHDPADPVAETRWLHRVAEQSGFPHAIVGWAMFCRSNIAEVLAGHAAFPLTRGIRQKPAAASGPDAIVPGYPGSMADPAFRAGYALLAEFGLHYELQTPWWHLGEAVALARDFPDTMIVLNHAGLPANRSATGLAGWREAMEGFAAEANTAVKISGLGVRDEAWTVAENGPIVRAAIDIFGPQRCMFASNFPVDSLVGDYATIYGGFREITADFPESDRRALFHDTARRLYRIAS